MTEFDVEPRIENPTWMRYLDKFPDMLTLAPTGNEYIARISPRHYFHISKHNGRAEASNLKQSLEWLYPYPGTSLHIDHINVTAAVVSDQNGTVLYDFSPEDARVFFARPMNQDRKRVGEPLLPESRPAPKQLYFEYSPPHQRRP